MFAFTQDVPINADIHAKLREELGAEKPNGLLMHLAVRREEGGLRYVDVWQSEDDWARFAAERLHPALERVFASVGFRPPEVEPETKTLDVVDVW